MKFLHTMLRVKDIDKSLRFYTELIGLKQLRKMELKAATLYFLSDERECCTIELTYNHEQPEEGYSHGSYFGHLAFEADSLDEFTEKLHAFGLEYTRPPFLVKEGGPKIAFLNDPDGYSIEVIEKR